MICENVPSIEFVQPDVFLEADPFLNALMPCKGESIINKMNLNAWATASPRFIVPDNMLLDAIERARYYYKQPSIGTVKELKPHDPEIVGLTPTGCWTLFL